jgi:hypothetical protein
MIVSIDILILRHFLLSGLPQRLVDVCRLAKLAVLERVVRLLPALVEVPWSSVVLKVALHLHIAPQFPPARCLHSHLMATVQRTEQRRELRDGPVVGLGRALAAVVKI